MLSYSQYREIWDETEPFLPFIITFSYLTSNNNLCTDHRLLFKGIMYDQVTKLFAVAFSSLFL